MTFTNIATDVNAMELDAIVCNISNDFTCVKQSLEKGYQKKNLATIRAYKGRYGVGFVIIHNYNSWYRQLFYYVVDKVNDNLKEYIDYIDANVETPNYRKF